MAEQKDWAFPAELRPKPEDWRFDLDARARRGGAAARRDPGGRLHRADPRHRARRQRRGDPRRRPGAHHRLPDHRGERDLAHHQQGRGRAGGFPLAYDQATGFGLVQPLGKLGVQGRSRAAARRRCRVGENVVVAGHGGRAHALKATVFAKREFAGYWEYVLDEALFTAPAHPQWGGAALIGADGKLARHRLAAGAGEGRRRHPAGQHARADRPARADPRRHAEDRRRSSRTPRPWLGMYTTEAGERAGGRRPRARRPGRARRRQGRRRGARRRRREAREPRRPLAPRLAPRPPGRRRPDQARRASGDLRRCASTPPTAATSSRSPTCTNTTLIRGQGQDSLSEFGARAAIRRVARASPARPSTQRLEHASS